MKKKIISCILFAVLITTIAGCSKKEAAGSAPSAKGDMAMDSAVSYESNGSLSDTAQSKVENKASEEKSSQKKVIQTGEVRIIVDDLKGTSVSLRSKTDELGGYIESENLTEYSSSARVRIPSGKLDDFMNYLDKSFEVEGKNTSAQDITSVYMDNDARLKNYRAQEEQTLEIMKKAKTVEEILQVQNELFRVRAEIESLEARKKAWDRDVDFSTITIYANKKYTAIESKLRVLTGSEFFKSISKGFGESTTRIILFIQNLIIFVISNIIMLAIFGVLGFFGYKKFVKGKIKR